MNTKLKALTKAIDAVAEAERKATEAKQALPEHAAAMKANEAMRNAAFECFASDKYIKQALLKVQSSNEYTFDTDGELCSWIRFEPNTEYLDKGPVQDLLNEFLQNEFVIWDTDCNALLSHQGGYIQINEDGDVFNCEGPSCKVIINASDYSSDTERNELIEAWMHKNGYFPGVFQVSRYGDVRLINTQPKAKRGKK